MISDDDDDNNGHMAGMGIREGILIDKDRTNDNFNSVHQTNHSRKMAVTKRNDIFWFTRREEMKLQKIRRRKHGFPLKSRFR
jgi:hypothetical protein